jgi:putative flippase GtrA
MALSQPAQRTRWRVATIARQVERLRTSGIVGQLVRFGVVGAISTVIYALVYLPLADFVLAQGWAVVAVPPAFLAAAAVGFVLHSGWSFRGHGSRDRSGRQHLKFLLVQGFGMLLNMAFTWVLTGPLGQPTWTPLIPVVLVTPLATFALYRLWVFA